MYTNQDNLHPFIKAFLQGEAVDFAINIDWIWDERNASFSVVILEGKGIMSDKLTMKTRHRGIEVSARKKYSYGISSSA